MIAAADAAGALLSELSRLLMHHEPTMTVTVPDWVADRVICAARLGGVTEPVAGAWLLAEGTSRLVHAAEADRLDFLTDKIPGLDITNTDSAPHCRQLQVQTPGADLFVALGWLAKLAKAALRVSGRSEGVEEGPVGFAGVEQGSDSVVVEVGEPEGGAFDAFDQVVGSYLEGLAPWWSRAGVSCRRHVADGSGMRLWRR